MLGGAITGLLRGISASRGASTAASAATGAARLSNLSKFDKISAALTIYLIGDALADGEIDIGELATIGIDIAFSGKTWGKVAAEMQHNFIKLNPEVVKHYKSMVSSLGGAATKIYSVGDTVRVAVKTISGVRIADLSRDAKGWLANGKRLKIPGTLGALAAAVIASTLILANFSDDDDADIRVYDPVDRLLHLVASPFGEVSTVEGRLRMAGDPDATDNASVMVAEELHALLQMFGDDKFSAEEYLSA